MNPNTYEAAARHAATAAAGPQQYVMPALVLLLILGVIAAVLYAARHGRGPSLLGTGGLEAALEGRIARKRRSVLDILGDYIHGVREEERRAETRKMIAEAMAGAPPAASAPAPAASDNPLAAALLAGMIKSAPKT